MNKIGFFNYFFEFKKKLKFFGYIFVSTQSQFPIVILYLFFF
jgi:hypothetical protein